MDKEYERIEYNIPLNFNDGGYVFNGQIPKRKFIDAIVLALIGVGIAAIIPIGGYIKISLYIFFGGILGAAGLVGYKDIPISEIARDYLHWRSRRKNPCFYNDNYELFTISAAEAMLEQEQSADFIAEFLEKRQEKANAKRPKYILGETYEFFADPETVAIRMYEDERKQKAEQQQAQQEQEEQQKKEAAEAAPAMNMNISASSGSLDIDDIMNDIVLTDMGEGG